MHGSIVEMYFIKLMVKSAVWSVTFKLTFICIGLCSYLLYDINNNAREVISE